MYLGFLIINDNLMINNYFKNLFVIDKLKIVGKIKQTSGNVQT